MTPFHAIIQYTEKGEFSLKPDYTMGEVRSSIKRLLKEKKIRLQKTNECPVLTPFYWYIGTLSLGQGMTVESSGESFDNNTAQMRCIGELFERIPIAVRIKSRQIQNSNGLSYALTVREGIFNSYRELVERHVILDYWLKKKECIEIVGFGRWFLLNRLSGIQNNLRARFYYFPNDYGFCVVCCHLSSKHSIPYDIFGYGCHQSVDKAMEKAFLEAWRFYWEFGKLKQKEGLRKDGLVEECIDHFKFYAFSKNAENCFFPKEKMSPRKIQRLTNMDEDFSLDDIHIFEPKKYHIPGYCIKVAKRDFWEFKSGNLTQDTEERKRGDVHPIA